MIYDACKPAKLNVFDGALNVTICADVSLHIAAIGVCSCSGKTRSAWTSSANISTLYFRHKWAIFSSSLFVQTRPTGLLGEQRIKALTPVLSFASKSLKSMV